VQFLLFDVSATLTFLLGYLAVVALQRRRMPAVTMGAGHAPGALRAAGLPAPVREDRSPSVPAKERATEPCCREWPRLSAPR